MYRIVQDVDPNAFIVEFDVNTIKGGVLRHYIDKKNNATLKNTLKGFI
jgi:Uncharacterized protein conserved in bacteria (DUF2179).